MPDTNIVKPCLTLLNQEQVRRVHSDALRILSSVGVRVDSEEARELLISASGAKWIKGDRVRIPAQLVERALQTAPSSIDVYDRDGCPAFRLPHKTRFGIGVTALNYQDPETDAVIPFGRKHMEMIVRLGDALSSFDVISTVGVIQDVAPELSDLFAALEMTANTRKPLVLLVSNENRFPMVLDLLEELHGDLALRPSIIPYINPITPLVINRGTIDKMKTAIEHGLPFIYSNYGMAGASTPITPAGGLVLMNAELLAGLTLGQLMKPGTPMILGSLPSCFNMRGKGSFYDPKSYLIDLACAEMMCHYQLPHVGTSGSGQGWGADLIASGHQWMNHLLSCMGKVGLAPFVGDILDSIVFSPAMIVYADDIIAQARHFVQGFALDEAGIGMDEIAHVGPGGDFLMSDLTLKHFRNAFYQSPIFEKVTLDEWQTKGSPSAEETLRRYTRRLLDGLTPPIYHEETMARGEAFIRKKMNVQHRTSNIEF